MTTVHGLVGAFVAIGVLAVAGTATAAGGGEKEPKGKAGTTQGASASATLGAGDEVGVTGPERNAPRGRAAGEEKKGDEEEKRFLLSLDFVVGFGKQPVVDANGATPLGAGGTGALSAPTVNQARMTTYSFIAGVGYEFAHGLEAGVRLPVDVGSIASPENRGTAALANLELEAAYLHELNETLGLEFALGISLPTAQGAPIPDGAIPSIGGGYNQSGYDRFSVHNAVAASRGYEDNALYDIDHLGLIPKVKLLAHGDKWRVAPWVKLENLVATTSDQAHSYTGELVLGVEGGYYVAPVFEPALRLWTNIPVSGADFTAVAVVEPQLRFHVGEVTPLLGVILPFAGPLTNPQAAGVRIAIGGKF
jgi:hypothetical protein